MDNYGLGTLLTEMRNRYPMIYNWIDGQTSELLEGWLENLRDVPIESAVDIVKYWHKNGAPFLIEPKQWQEIPRFILHEHRRLSSSSDAYTVNLRKKGKSRPSNLSETLTKITRTRNPEMKKAIIEQAIAALPPDDPDEMPRYKCRKCKDTAYVLLYLDYQTTASAMCGLCEYGQWLFRSQRQSAARIQSFDPKKFPWHVADDPAGVRTHIDRWREMSQSQRYQAYTGKKLIEEHDDF